MLSSALDFLRLESSLCKLRAHTHAQNNNNPRTGSRVTMEHLMFLRTSRGPFGEFSSFICARENRASSQGQIHPTPSSGYFEWFSSPVIGSSTMLRTIHPQAESEGHLVTTGLRQTWTPFRFPPPGLRKQSSRRMVEGLKSSSVQPCSTVQNTWPRNEGRTEADEVSRPRVGISKAKM